MRKRRLPAQRSQRMREELVQAFGRTAFPVYMVQSPRLGAPMIGDAHLADGDVESVGIAYGNPLLAGPVTQVITAPTQKAQPLNDLLDVETGGLHPRWRRPGRHVHGQLRVVCDGAATEVSVKRDGHWWAIRLETDEVIISVLSSGEQPEELVLTRVTDLLALVRDREHAVAKRTAEAEAE